MAEEQYSCPSCNRKIDVAWGELTGKVCGICDNVAINNVMAFNFRRNGYVLPTDREYVDPRTKEIALEMEPLLRRIAELDSELHDLYFTPVSKV